MKFFIMKLDGKKKANICMGKQINWNYYKMGGELNEFYPCVNESHLLESVKIHQNMCPMSKNCIP